VRFRQPACGDRPLPAPSRQPALDRAPAGSPTAGGTPCV
ncbi:MAG: hypothetical protein AVDCRST_MAG59-3681, partial [uncultured Thermomicrobiales bacterium]